MFLFVKGKEEEKKRFLFHYFCDRALDLLYGMCDMASAKQIVRQLLDYLVKAEYEVRHELATKVALLAERFSSNKAWYIDVMLELLKVAGEDVSNDIWHRVIRVVLSCSEDVQAYAARYFFLLSGSLLLMLFPPERVSLL